MLKVKSGDNPLFPSFYLKEPFTIKEKMLKLSSAIALNCYGTNFEAAMMKV